jgi:hypothetical protein
MTHEWWCGGDIVLFMTGFWSDMKRNERTNTLGTIVAMQCRIMEEQATPFGDRTVAFLSEMTFSWSGVMEQQKTYRSDGPANLPQSLPDYGKNDDTITEPPPSHAGHLLEVRNEHSFPSLVTLSWGACPWWPIRVSTR